MPITGWLNHPVFAEDGSLQSNSTSQGRAFFFFFFCDAGGAGDEYFKNDKYPLII